MHCSICEESYLKEEMVCMADCEHRFCIHCLRKYCTAEINSMKELMCPQEGCSATINENSIFFTGLPQDIKNRLKRNQHWKQTISNPELRLCLTADC
jgi:hypothetical protein